MKRFTIPAVVLGVLVLSLLVARPALTSPQDEKKPREEPKLEQLQKERIETLQQMVNVAEEQHKIGIGSFKDLPELNKVKEKLVKARLEATEDPAERIALFEQQIKVAQETFDTYQKRRDLGFEVSDLDVLQAKAHLLKVEIKLVKERAKVKPAP